MQYPDETDANSILNFKAVESGTAIKIEGVEFNYCKETDKVYGKDYVLSRIMSATWNTKKNIIELFNKEISNDSRGYFKTQGDIFEFIQDIYDGKRRNGISGEESRFVCRLFRYLSFDDLSNVEQIYTRNSVSGSDSLSQNGKTTNKLQVKNLGKFKDTRKRNGYKNRGR